MKHTLQGEMYANSTGKDRFFRGAYSLPEGKQLLRSTWVVGDSFNREQQVDLVCKLAQEALKDKFAPHIKNFAPGLANYIEIVSQD